MPANPFLQAVLNEPEDDLARLVYADWLDEQGDPRGEFIRVQVELATLTPADDSWRDLKNRETELLNQYLADWFDGMRRVWSGFSQCKYQPFFTGRGSCQLVRGFRESARVRTRVFLEHAAKIFEQMPLRKLRLFERDHGEEEFQRFAESPFLEKLTHLAFDWRGNVEPQLQALLTHPHSRNLQELEFWSANVPGIVDPLRKAADVSQLRRLAIHFASRYGYSQDQRLAPETAKRLAEQCQLPKLESFALTSYEVTFDFLKRLLKRAKWRETVHDWDWSGHDFGDKGLEFLASLGLSSRWTQLRLNAETQSGRPQTAGPFTRAGMQALATMDFTSLKVFEITGHRIGSGKLRSLLRNPTLSNLEELDLSNNPIKDSGAAVLAKVGHLSKLKTLRLKNCGLTKIGLQSLMNSKSLPELRCLYLDNNPSLNDAIRTLVESSMVSQLRTLSLSGISQLSYRQFQQLAKTGELGNLAELDISGQPFLQRNLLTLAESPHLEHLAHLHWNVGYETRPSQLLEMAEARWPGRCRI